MQNKTEESFLSIPKKDRAKAFILLQENDIPYDGFHGAEAELNISYQSELNFKEPQFNEKEKFLADCYQVFKHYHSVDNFVRSECTQKTGVTDYTVKQIYDKYLKNGKNTKKAN